MRRGDPPTIEGEPASFFNLSPPDGEGTELMEELREASPGFQTLVLTKCVERTNLALAVEARDACVLREIRILISNLRWFRAEQLTEALEIHLHSGIRFQR